MADLAVSAPPSVELFGGQLLLQLYRGAMRRRDELLRDLDGVRALGLRSVILHGGPTDVHDRWADLSRECAQRGLAGLASWGLDGTSLTPRQEGLLMGDVLASASCAGGLADAEGRWDLGGSDPSRPSEAGALELGGSVLERAPHARVGDQPWPWILSHAGIRRTAAPLREGGSLRGFPVDEFARMAQTRFIQLYYEDFPQGLWPVKARAEHDWGEAGIAPALRTLGLERPVRVTLQGYAHDRHPHHFAWALLHYHVELAQDVVLWCEPFPPPLSLAIIRAVQQLVREGFARAGVDPRDAVRAWQADYNRRAPSEKHIAEDGWLGYEGLRALGLWT